MMISIKSQKLSLLPNVCKEALGSIYILVLPKSYCSITHCEALLIFTCFGMLQIGVQEKKCLQADMLVTYLHSKPNFSNKCTVNQMQLNTDIQYVRLFNTC